MIDGCPILSVLSKGWDIEQSETAFLQPVTNPSLDDKTGCPTSRF